MHIKRLMILAMLSLVVWQCHPSFLKPKTPKEKENIDSLLFYQKKDVADPFLDGLLLNTSDSPVEIKTTVVPEVVTPKFKEAEGYRVQIFASIDSLKAAQILRQVKSMVKDSSYLVHEKNLFKIQIGDFLYRQPADSLKEFLKQAGFTGAWTVQRSIRLPISTENAAQATQTANTPSSQLQSYYQIQVFATTDQQKAQTIVNQLATRFDYPCTYTTQNNLFKVLLGKFADRTQAETALKEVKALGFQDAWIVHKP